jgi:hypothetical protein
MKDSRISIIQYIKSGAVSIENQISNIKAGSKINIEIEDFFSNSPDYQRLQKQIIEMQDRFEKATNEQERYVLSTQLNNLAELKKEFKTDVLRLADIFAKMDLRTERLRQAAALFEEGKFREADAVLKEEDLGSDQFNLLVMADYLELQLNNFWAKFKTYIDHDRAN